MRAILLFVIIILLVTGCNNKKTENLPPAPSTNDAVATAITGKKFKVTELALISTLISDKNNPYEWFDEIKDTTPFFRNYEKQKKKLTIHFINDTAVQVTEDTVTNQASWKIVDQPKNDETPGKFLRLLMDRGEPLFPGQTGRSTITFSYKVLGIDDSQLFLETPSIFNGRKVAVLMKRE